MSASPADVQPVLDAVARHAALLCAAPFARVLIVDGELLRPQATYRTKGERVALARPVPLRRTSISGRAILERRTIHHADVFPLLDTEYPDARDNARRVGFHAVLMVPLLREHGAHGTIFVWRREAQAFTPDQIALVETFAREAAIAIENVRLFNATREALEQQMATSEILRLMSASPTDVRPVLEAVARQAALFCNAPFGRVFLVEGDVLRDAATYAAGGERGAVHANPVLLRRSVINGRAILDRKTIHHADVAPLLDSEYPDARENARRVGFRAVLAVPLLREGGAYGSIFVWRRETLAFPPDQIALVETFARQAAIAIENVRLFNATKEALDQQMAASEILQVISRSPTDVQPVFDTIAASALRLCDASYSALYRFDGELIHVAALHKLDPKATAAFHAVYPSPPNPHGVTHRAVLTGQIVHVPDVLAEPDYGYQAAARAAEFRSVLSVPMLHDGRPIGTITVYRDEPKPFPESQVALLRTFADQAVIAVENVRLFTELQARNGALTEALEQQTATGEILQVISRSPTDVLPVFDTIAAAALKLCGGTSATVARTDGEWLDVPALASWNRGAADALRPQFPRRVGRDTVLGRAVLERGVVAIRDVLEDPDYAIPDIARAAGYRSALAVPLLRDGQPIGAIAVVRPEPGFFPDTQIALLRTFADQAVIAIENVRLFTELEERNRDLTVALDQQTATSEILRVISGAQTDVAPVFDAIVRAAVRLCDARHCLAASFDGELLHPLAFHGFSPDALDFIARSFPMKPTRATMIGRVALSGSVEMIEDMSADPEYSQEYRRAGGWRSGLAVPMLRDGRVIGVIVVSRGGPGTYSEQLVALLQTFADQAVIAIENVRLFTELQTRNRELTVSLDQQTATSEILRVISSAQTDLAPVFEAIVGAAVRLSGADYSVAARFDGEMLHPLAFHGFTAEGLEAANRMFPMPPSRINMLGRAALSRSVIRVPDMLADPEYSHEYALAGGWRSGIAVPMLRDDRLIGVIGISRRETGAFPDAIVSLLQTFADQAVIAIENVRLFTELQTQNRALTEALEQQTATSELLKEIGRSTFDLQPVFTTLVENAVRLCGAERGLIFRFDGQWLRVAVTQNVAPELRDFFDRNPIAIDRHSNAGRAALERRTIHNRDVRSDPDYKYGGKLVDPYRTVLAVPMLKGSELLGVIVIYRHEVRPFTDNQIALMETFADQAVIAIENVRLFTELERRNADLTEALEQQTATSDILRVISRSQTDVQPVFDTIAESVGKLCQSEFANVFTFDGTLVHLDAFVNVNRQYVEVMKRYYPRGPGRGTGALRAIATASVCIIPDVLEDPEYELAGPSSVSGFRSVLAVPLLRNGKAIGAIAVGRPTPGAFPESQIALLQTFADQAVIAIENVRLFKELAARTTELTRSVNELRALGEVGRAVSSTLDLPTVLATVVSRASALTGMDGGSIWEYDEAAEVFHLHATDNLPDELVVALRSSPIRKGEGALGRVAMTGEPVQIRDIATEKSYRARVRELLVRCGYRSVLAVPLLREGHLLGGLIVNGSSAGDFAPEVIDLLKTFAAQSALAIQNARLFREIEVKGRQLEIASQHKSEFLANMSHELRTPLNAIIGFSEVLTEQMFGELNAKQQEYLADILESGRHLLSLINDILDLSKIEAGRMELEPADFDLPSMIQNAMILVRERASRHGIRLGCSVDERLGMIRADERKVKQVLLNLLSNALKFTPEGGAVSVRADAHNGVAEISVSDTGVGIAPEDQAAVFEEFRQVGTAAKKVEGTGLGLAISRKFVELHGGSIRLASEPGKGSTFTFTLPLGGE